MIPTPYDCIWRWSKLRPDRKDAKCRILARCQKHQFALGSEVVVEFEDGEQVTVRRQAVRRVRHPGVSEET